MNGKVIDLLEWRKAKETQGIRFSSLTDNIEHLNKLRLQVILESFIKNVLKKN